MQANVRGRMERMLVRDKNSGAQTTPDFSKQVSDNKTKNTPSVGKGYSYSFLLCFSSFVVCLYFCLSFFLISFFLFLFFCCYSLPFSCLFHSFSSLHFPSNLQKNSKRKKQWTKKQHQQQEEDKQEKITGARQKMKTNARTTPPQKKVLDHRIESAVLLSVWLCEAQ